MVHETIHKLKMRMQRGSYAACAAILLFAVVACDNERLHNTQAGLTTENEVLTQWGQPENVWTNAQGQRVFEYNRQPEGAVNYMITIGADGKVVSLRNVLTRNNFARIQTGMMLEDVRKMLGKPARAVPYELKGETEYEWRWREGTGGAPFRLFVVVVDNNWVVKRTEDRLAPTHSDMRER